MHSYSYILAGRITAASALEAAAWPYEMAPVWGHLLAGAVQHAAVAALAGTPALIDLDCLCNITA